MYPYHDVGLCPGPMLNWEKNICQDGVHHQFVLKSAGNEEDMFFDHKYNCLNAMNRFVSHLSSMHMDPYNMVKSAVNHQWGSQAS